MTVKIPEDVTMGDIAKEAAKRTVDDMWKLFGGADHIRDAGIETAADLFVKVFRDAVEARRKEYDDR